MQGFMGHHPHTISDLWTTEIRHGTDLPQLSHGSPSVLPRFASSHDLLLPRLFCDASPTQLFCDASPTVVLRCFSHGCSVMLLPQLFCDASPTVVVRCFSHSCSVMLLPRLFCQFAETRSVGARASLIWSDMVWLGARYLLLRCRALTHGSIYQTVPWPDRTEGQSKLHRLLDQQHKASKYLRGRNSTQHLGRSN